MAQQKTRVITNKAGTKSIVAPPKPDLSTTGIAQRTGLEKHLPPPKPTAPGVATGKSGAKQYPPEGAVTSGRGRTAILKTMSKEEIQKEVDVLLDDLRKETDGEEKKSIRRKLRARGHWGGLGGQGAAKPAVKVTPAKPANKAK